VLKIGESTPDPHRISTRAKKGAKKQAGIGTGDGADGIHGPSFIDLLAGHHDREQNKSFEDFAAELDRRHGTSGHIEKASRPQ